MSKTVLVVLNGESYRSGSQMTRTRGTGEYIKPQILASRSHIKLVNELKNKGYNVDVCINSYKLNTKDDELLLKYYNANCNVVKSILNDKNFGSEHNFLKQLNKTIIPIMNNYDFIMYVRIDLYLKQYFFENLKLDENKIIISHIDSNVVDLKTAKDMFVSHCLITISKKMYIAIEENMIGHNLRNFLLNKRHIKPNEIEFMVNTLHVCSTDLGWNPLYIQVGRKYSDKYSNTENCQNSIEYYYVPDNNKFIQDINKTTLYWKPYLTIDGLNENLEKLNENSFEDFFQN